MRLLFQGFLLFFLVSFYGNNLYSQNINSEIIEGKRLTYPQFLEKLIRQNLKYASRRYEVSIAEAEQKAARILPDPELSFAAYDNQERRLKMGYGFEAELAWNLELGGKRKARINLANKEKHLADLEFLDFFHDLRAESTLIFLEALKNRRLYEYRKTAFEAMLDLATLDSIRHANNEISSLAARQSSLEARSMYRALQDAANEWGFSLMDLKNVISSEKHDTIYIPSGDLERFDRVFELEDLIKIARESRVDLLIAGQNRQVAGSRIDLAKAERIMDLGLSLGIENNSFAKNIIGPTPGHTVVKAGISVPIKFSNNRESGFAVASYEAAQAELQYTAIELELEKEITIAYRNYRTRQNQVQSFKTHIVEEAKQVFEAVKQDYLQGKTSLLEVLNAERTYHNIQHDYIETLFKYAAALVELERTAGIWDIDF